MTKTTRKPRAADVCTMPISDDGKTRCGLPLPCAAHDGKPTPEPKTVVAAPPPSAAARDRAMTTLMQHAPLAEALFTTIVSLQVNDEQTAGLMADARKDLGDAQKRLKTAKSSITAPLSDVVKAVNALFKPAEDRLEDALDVTKRKLNQYAQMQLQIEAEKKAAQLREAREQEQQSAIAAKTLRDAGASDTAEIVELQAASAVAIASGPAHVAAVKGASATFSVSKRWIGRVMNVKALAKAIGEGRVPEEVFSVNLRALNDHAKTLGEPMVANDPAAIERAFIEQGFMISLTAEGATR